MKAGPKTGVKTITCAFLQYQPDRIRSTDPPPLKWTSVKYGFDHVGPRPPIRDHLVEICNMQPVAETWLLTAPELIFARGTLPRSARLYLAAGTRMKRRLPPLTALRAFEAAARHLSFTRAANELSVTQAAISHQIKALEEHMSTKLFVDGARRTQLSPSGRELSRALTLSFDQIAATVEGIRSPSDEYLRILVSPFLSANWLAMRLPIFEAASPSHRIKLQHVTKAEEIHWNNFDVAILWGSGDWADARSEMLFPLKVTPMCSPSLLAATGAHELKDLRNVVLIHNDDRDGWKRWAQFADVPLNADEGPVFDDVNVQIRAVLAGLGVGLLPENLGASEYVESRQLIRLSELSMPTSDAYYVIHSHQVEVSLILKAFIDWLKAQSIEDELRTI